MAWEYTVIVFPEELGNEDCLFCSTDIYCQRVSTSPPPKGAGERKVAAFCYVIMMVYFILVSPARILDRQIFSLSCREPPILRPTWEKEKKMCSLSGLLIGWLQLG